MSFQLRGGAITGGMVTPAHAFFNWAILRKWFHPWWVVAGSVLPDAPPFVAFFYLLAQKGINPPSMGGFFGFVMANGNPNRQPGFMEISFLLNALPLYALVGILVLVWRKDWLSALWAGWGLHIVEDFLTHVEDAYAPLYPFFQEWRPPGIVSYWDPRYGAESFQAIQYSVAGLILAWIFGKRLLARRRVSASREEEAPQERSRDGENPRKGA
ncbi:MAG: hypothetical protein M3522_06480 [Actinomycetota bacterium]|nr:hypothetical protein [Actinomycetota bacterium]